MNDRTLISTLLVLTAGAAAYYYWSRQTEPEALPPPPLVELPAPVVVEPEIIHPIEIIEQVIEPVEPTEPLPLLADSDTAMIESMTELFGGQPVDDLLITKEIIARFVATIDSLPSRQLAPLIRPTKPLPGKLLVSGDKKNYQLDPGNYSRYAPYLALAEMVDVDSLVSTYIRYYPLFQEAFEALGYPDGYFNDRLIAVTDHLIATPDVSGPVALVKPEAFYLYADPELESLSAGQKILIRMGGENAAVIKSKLQQIRDRLAAEEGI
jgi:hypothetical protein